MIADLLTAEEAARRIERSVLCIDHWLAMPWPLRLVLPFLCL
jgi:hypothetical protein